MGPDLSVTLRNAPQHLAHWERTVSDTRKYEFHRFDPANLPSNCMCRTFVSRFKGEDIDLICEYVVQESQRDPLSTSIGTACSGSDNIIDWDCKLSSYQQIPHGQHVFSCDNSSTCRTFIRGRHPELACCFSDIKGAWPHFG